eukprot:scaffold94695_cov51-Cyclotella_meneghiniana.AAC.2
MAKSTGLTEVQIHYWFHEKRIGFSEHESDPYPTKEQREELGMITGLSEDQVRLWFSRKRYRTDNSKSYKENLIKWHDENEAMKMMMKWYDENEANPKA